MTGAPAAPERLGLFGGTFDPPHEGHLDAARAVRDLLALDRLLLVVANDPWQKSPVRAVSPAEDRYAMTAAAVTGLERVQASRLEIDRGGPSYTIDTVEELMAAAVGAGRPAPEIFVAVGADLVASLPTWHRADELAALVTLAVVARPGSPAVPTPSGWRSVPVAARTLDVSSSQVRALVAAGQPLEGRVPESVIRCIRRRDLYAVSR